MGSNSGDSQSGERSIRLKNLEIERKRLEKENEEKRKKLLELQKREMIIKKAAENGELYANFDGLDDISNKKDTKEERVLEIHIEKEEEFMEEEDRKSRSSQRSQSGMKRHSDHKSRSPSFEWKSKKSKSGKSIDKSYERGDEKKELIDKKDTKDKDNGLKEDKKNQKDDGVKEKIHYKDDERSNKRHEASRSLSSSPSQTRKHYDKRPFYARRRREESKDQHHHRSRSHSFHRQHSQSKHHPSPPIHHKSTYKSSHPSPPLQPRYPSSIPHHHSPPIYHHPSRSPSPTIETSCKLDYFFTHTKYFLIKSSNHENVALAQAKNIWSTPPPNEVKFNQAFKDHSNVILIFSIKESGHFQGYARVKRESDRQHPPIRWVLPVGVSAHMLSAVFHLQWINKKELSFDKVNHLRNSLNDGRSVKIGRDGQEVDEVSGEALCRLFPKDPSINLRDIAQVAKDSLKLHHRTVAETRARIQRVLQLQDERRREMEVERRLVDAERRLVEAERRTSKGSSYDLDHRSDPAFLNRRVPRGRMRHDAAVRRPSYGADYQRGDFYSRSPEDTYEDWRGSHGNHYRRTGHYEGGRERWREPRDEDRRRVYDGRGDRSYGKDDRYYDKYDRNYDKHNRSYDKYDRDYEKDGRNYEDYRYRY